MLVYRLDCGEKNTAMTGDVLELSRNPCTSMNTSAFYTFK